MENPIIYYDQYHGKFPLINTVGLRKYNPLAESNIALLLGGIWQKIGHSVNTQIKVKTRCYLIGGPTGRIIRQNNHSKIDLDENQ